MALTWVGVSVHIMSSLLYPLWQIHPTRSGNCPTENMSDQRWIKWKQYRSKHHRPNINRRRYMYQKYYILILPMVFIASSSLSPLPLHPPSLSIECQYIYVYTKWNNLIIWRFHLNSTSFQASSPFVIWRKTACHGISMKQT